MEVFYTESGEIMTIESIENESQSQEVQFLQLAPGPSDVPEYTQWPRKVTLRLLAEYKSLHIQLGTGIRSRKMLYNIIATRLNQQFKLNLSGSQISNKFKTLERAYKAVVDNNKKTGRGRKTFEFENEMNTIFQHTKKIHPELLLSEADIEPNKTCISTLSTCNANSRDVATTASLTGATVVSVPSGRVDDNEASTSTTAIQTSASSCKSVHTDKRKKNRQGILAEMQQERRAFYQQYLQLQQTKLEYYQRRTAVMEERNQLLKEYLKSHQ